MLNIAQQLKSFIAQQLKFEKPLLVFFILMFVFYIPVEAKKDKKNKVKTTGVVDNHDPDAINHKSKPDSHPRALEKPTLFYCAASGLQGVDISHHDGKIDWAVAAKDSHVGFVYLKCSEGKEFKDNTYEYNLSECRRNGVKVGSYHFFRPNVSAKDQFNNFRSICDGSKQDILPCIDVEIKPDGMSRAKFEDCLEDLLQMIEKEYGVRPIIYTGKNYYNHYFYGTRFVGKYKFWIAAYNIKEPVLDGNDDFLIWQYGSDGKVNGINHRCDLNRFVRNHSLREILY